MSRTHIGLKTKLASAICLILEINHDHQLLMSEDQVLSLVDWDHWPRRKADGGTDDFHNLFPRAKAAHRVKTRTVDIPQIAKRKRITARPIVTGLKDLDRPNPQSKRGGRKIQSRPFQKATPIPSRWR